MLNAYRVPDCHPDSQNDVHAAMSALVCSSRHQVIVPRNWSADSAIAAHMPSRWPACSGTRTRPAEESRRSGEGVFMGIDAMRAGLSHYLRCRVRPCDPVVMTSSSPSRAAMKTAQPDAAPLAAYGVNI